MAALVSTRLPAKARASGGGESSTTTSVRGPGCCASACAGNAATRWGRALSSCSNRPIWPGWTRKSRHGYAPRYDSTKDRLEFEYRGTKISTDVPRSASLPFLSFPHWRRDPKWNTKLKGLYALVSCFSPFHSCTQPLPVVDCID